MCVGFMRLFDLVENKSISVADMCGLGWEERGVAWQWRCRLWAWEEELLEECMILLHDISLQINSTNHWQWMLDPSGSYSVWSVYQKLTTQEFPSFYATSDLIWHKTGSLEDFYFALASSSKAVADKE